jgi:hypothetical protein
MAASIINAEVPRFSYVSDLVRHILRDNMSPAAACFQRSGARWRTGAWAGSCIVRRRDEITRCPALPRL